MPKSPKAKQPRNQSRLLCHRAKLQSPTVQGCDSCRDAGNQPSSIFDIDCKKRDLQCPQLVREEPGLATRESALSLLGCPSQLYLEGDWEGLGSPWAHGCALSACVLTGEETGWPPCVCSHLPSTLFCLTLCSCPCFLQGFPSPAGLGEQHFANLEMIHHAFLLLFPWQETSFTALEIHEHSLSRHM